VHALAPSTLVAPSAKTIVALCHHPLVEVNLSLCVDDFHLKTNLVLDREAFISTLTHFPPLSSSGPSSMVRELLQNCFVPNDSANGFDLFF